jgi:hypothetical protein
MAISMNATATINMNAPHLAQFRSQIEQIYGRVEQMPNQWQKINAISGVALHQMRQATAAMQANATAATSQLNSFNASLARTSYTMNSKLIQPMMGFLGTAGRGFGNLGTSARQGIGRLGATTGQTIGPIGRPSARLGAVAPAVPGPGPVRRGRPAAGPVLPVAPTVQGPGPSAGRGPGPVSAAAQQQLNRTLNVFTQQLNKTSSIFAQQLNKTSNTLAQQMNKTSSTFAQQLNKTSSTLAQQIAKSLNTFSQQQNTALNRRQGPGAPVGRVPAGHVPPRPAAPARHVPLHPALAGRGGAAPVGRGPGPAGRGAGGGGRTGGPGAAGGAGAGGRRPGPNMTFGRGAFYAGRDIHSLMRILGFGTLVGGLVGGGSLYGLNQLSQGALSARQFARGTGTDYGFSQSLPTAFKGIFDAKALIQSVAGARLDMGGTGSSALWATGTNPYGGSTEDVTRSFILNLRNRTRGMNQMELGNYYQGNNIGGHLSPMDYQNITTLPEKEFQDKYMKQFELQKKLDIPDETTKAWADLNIQLESSGKILKESFLTGLVGLTGPMGELSSAVASAISALMHSPGMQEAVAEIGKHISGLAHIINPANYPELKKHMDKLGEQYKAHWNRAKGEFFDDWNAVKNNPLVKAIVGSINDKLDSINMYGPPAPAAASSTMGLWDRIAFFGKALFGGAGSFGGNNVAGGTIGGGAANALSGPTGNDAAGNWNPVTGNLNSIDTAILRSLYGNEANKDPKRGPTGYQSVGDKNANPMLQSYGAYQVRGINIGPWSKEHLSREIGITEFMQNPWMQDQIALGQFREYLKKNGGNFAESAANWNGGSGTTAAQVPAYVKSFIETYNKQPGVSKIEISVSTPPGHQTTVTQGINSSGPGVTYTLN